MTVVDDEMVESAWDEDVLDGEADFDEAEFIPGLGALIPGLGVLDPIGAGIRAIGQSLTPPTRPTAPTVSVPRSTGVNSAVVQTPRGQASIQLPSVVRTEDFNNAVARLQGAVNIDSNRINTLQRDLRSLGTRVGTVVGETQQAIARSRTETQRDLRRVRRETQAELKRLRSDSQQQQTTSLMMSMMMQQQLTSRLDEHTHAVTGATTGAPANAGGDDNMMMMMLPLMMMPQSSSGGGGQDNSMMFMMMAMMMGGR